MSPGNLRGVALMVLGMLGFAVADGFIKALGGAVPTGQILVTVGIGGGLIFSLLARREGQAIVTRAFLHPLVMLRNLFEVVGTLGFITALVFAPLSVASAIIQANPLIVTLGAAIWLKEPVGRYRWGAILLGLVGVLLVIRPGGAAFDPASLYAVIGVVGLSLRDLLTRRVPHRISTSVLSVYALALLVPAGLGLMAVTGQRPVTPDATQAGLLAGVIAISAIGYFGVTAAMRVGEVAVVTPFRYSRILFALVIAITVFDERPDALTWAGAAIIVASGLFTLWRERRRKTGDL